MKRINVVVSTLQVLSFLVSLVMFFAFIPWLGSYPIEELEIYSSTSRAPPNAESFSVNHGQYRFYTDSPSTDKLKAFGVVVFLVANWVFLVISSLYYTSKNKAEDTHGTTEHGTGGTT